MKKTVLIVLSFLIAHWLPAQHTIEIPHTYYTMWFDTVQSTELVGYYIQTTAHSTAQPKMPRSGKFARFTKDPLLEGKVWANDVQYKTWNRNHPNEKRDRGHINPFTAFDFAEDAALESMYYSNTAPQASYFNRHQWQAIEQSILKLSRGKINTPPIDSIHVWTGVLIHTTHPKKMNAVFEPDYFWKVIRYKHQGEYISKAWLGANESNNMNTNPDAIVVELAYLKEMIAKYYPALVLGF